MTQIYMVNKRNLHLQLFYDHDISEKFGGDAHEEIPCTAWTTKAPKFAQPDLNFIGKF